MPYPALCYTACRTVSVPVPNREGTLFEGGCGMTQARCAYGYIISNRGAMESNPGCENKRFVLDHWTNVFALVFYQDSANNELRFFTPKKGRKRTLIPFAGFVATSGLPEETVPHAMGNTVVPRRFPNLSNLHHFCVLCDITSALSFVFSPGCGFHTRSVARLAWLDPWTKHS